MSELKENRKEPKQIKFRVSEIEYQRLNQLASSVGMTVPAFCKNVAQKKRVKAPLIDKQGAKEIAQQLRKIGVNVNQIAFNSNIGNTPTQEQLYAIQKELGELWQLLNSALQNQRTD